MEHSIKKIYRYLILIIIILAFFIRFKGIWFGYPLPLHPDEQVIVENALRMLATGDINPHFFNYPTFNIYLQTGVYSFVNLINQIFFDTPVNEVREINYYLSGRLFNVLLSTITIYIIYEIGRRLVDPIAGLASACFIGASFLHISNSFTVTVDSPVAFWLSLSTLMAVLIYTKGKENLYYLMGGIFVGLAISSKYISFLGVAPILVAHYKASCTDKHFFDTNIIIYLLVIPTAFFITSPYVILDYKPFFEALRFESHHYRTGHPGAEASGDTSFYLYGKYLTTMGYGFLPILFSSFGLIWFLKKDPWKAALLLSTPLLLFVFVGQYKVFFPRNIVAVIPFLSLFSGAFIFALYEWLKSALSGWEKFHWITATSTIVFVIALLFFSIGDQVTQAYQYIQTITLPDTRWESVQWIKDHMPTGSHIGREGFTPPIEKYTEQFHVSYLGWIAVVSNPEELKNLDYMIVSSYDYGPFLNSESKYPKEASIYNSFFKNNQLIYELIPDGITLGGPKISIYKIIQLEEE